MNIVTILFIMATQALAVLIFSIFPKIAYIISVVLMVGSLGATLSGVTFPVTAMYAPCMRRPTCFRYGTSPKRHRL